MAMPKEYDEVPVRLCVWGDPYLSVLLFPEGKKESKLALYFGLYNIH